MEDRELLQSHHSLEYLRGDRRYTHYFAAMSLFKMTSFYQREYYI